MNPYVYPLLPLYWEALNEKSLRLLTPAASEPISLTLAQQHLRLDLYADNGSPMSHPDDQLITDIYIPTAREYCESLSGWALALQEFEYSLRFFPGYDCGNPQFALRLPVGPLRQIVSITYEDGNGIQTLDPASYLPMWSTNTLYPAAGTNWPSGLIQSPNAAKVRFWAGYGLLDGSPTDNLPLPAKYKNAILLMLHHFYENRSGTEIPSQVPTAIEFGVKALLMPNALRNGFGTL